MRYFCHIKQGRDYFRCLNGMPYPAGQAAPLAYLSAGLSLTIATFFLCGHENMSSHSYGSCPYSCRDDNAKLVCVHELSCLSLSSTCHARKVVIHTESLKRKVAKSLSFPPGPSTPFSFTSLMGACCNGVAHYGQSAFVNDEDFPPCTT